MSLSIRENYNMLKSWPFGKKIFSKAVGRMAPYSGTIGAEVEELDDGYAKLILKDRPKIRNHLNSIHAIAMINLAELTTGLAFLYGLPKKTRGIPTGLSIEYQKKARGLLTAECHCSYPTDNSSREWELEATIKDSSNDTVAKAKARWMVGPES